MPKWLARIDASRSDLELVQQNYSDRFLTIEEHGQEKLIASHRFEACTTTLEARDEAVELLANINVVMELATTSFAGLRFNGVAKHRDGQLHQTIFAELYANLNVFLAAAATVTGGGLPIRLLPTPTTCRVLPRDRPSCRRSCTADMPGVWLDTR